MTDRIRAIHGDSREVLRTLADGSVDSVVTDPPYALVSIVKRFGKPGSAPAKGNDAYMRASAGFMGSTWDNGSTAHDPEFWREVYRVLKPGAHVVAFGGTRTFHRLVCAIEDAGFDVRDQIAWLFGSGFPKSHDVSKGIDRAAGAEREVVGYQKLTGTAKTLSGNKSTHGSWSDGARSIDAAPITAPATDAAREWQGWGSSLKPALEPICLARKPLIGTIAANVLAHGTGALNIAACRVPSGGDDQKLCPIEKQYIPNKKNNVYGAGMGGGEWNQNDSGRWPANVCHDGSAEVVEAFPDELTSGVLKAGTRPIGKRNTYQDDAAGGYVVRQDFGGDSGSAARFFYTAKADSGDRLGSKHPTVKPVDLMQWLVRLVTPRNGLCLDPFAGTGTTGEACYREGFRAILIEREAQYFADIQRRLKLMQCGPDERQRESIKASGKVQSAGPLFEEIA